MEFFAEQAKENTFADEPPPAPGPTSMRPPYNHKSSQPSMDRTRENPAPPPMNRFGSSNSQHQRQGSRNISIGSSAGSPHRSRPSAGNREMLSDNPSNGYPSRQQPNLTAATNDMVVPNKSRLREEEIEVPYARDSQIMEASRSASRADSRSSISESIHRARTPRDHRVDPMETLSPAVTDDRDYFDRMSFSSNVTSKSKQAGHGVIGWDDEREQKIRAEYEFRIAGLERRAAKADAEKDDAKRGEGMEKEKRKEWEDEVRGLKEVSRSRSVSSSDVLMITLKRAALHASSLRSLQHELDIARDAAETARRHGEQTSQSAQDEIAQWRDRCDGLEDELRRVEDDKAALEAGGGGGNVSNRFRGKVVAHVQQSDQAVVELKNEVHSLLDELNSLSMRNDEIMTEREQDAASMTEMEARVAEYKRKYDAVRIELRNLKGGSSSAFLTPDNIDR